MCLLVDLAVPREDGRQPWLRISELRDAGTDVLALTGDVINMTATLVGSLAARFPGLSTGRLEEFAVVLENFCRTFTVDREVKRAFSGACLVIQAASASLKTAANYEASEQAMARKREMKDKLDITKKQLAGRQATIKLLDHLFEAPEYTLSLDDLIRANGGLRVKIDSRRRDVMRQLCERARRHLDVISSPLRILRIANTVQLTTSD
jgi:hypothetical protein